MNRFYRIGFLLFVSGLLIVQVDAADKETKFDMNNTAHPALNLTTGGQPSLNDLTLLANGGIKRVINLRSKGEFTQFDEKKVVEGLGMDYVSIEINGMDGITEENAKLLNEALAGLSDATLVHCASSNRVGGLLAVRAYKFQGYSKDEALQLGKKSGMKSTEKRVKELFSKE